VLTQSVVINIFLESKLHFHKIKIDVPEQMNRASKHNKYAPLSQEQTRNWKEGCHDPSP